MRAYLWTTGTLFLVLTLAHLWRVVVAEPALGRDPWFLLTTVLSAALCVWAWRLTRASAPR